MLYNTLFVLRHIYPYIQRYFTFIDYFLEMHQALLIVLHTFSYSVLKITEIK